MSAKKPKKKQLHSDGSDFSQDTAFFIGYTSGLICNNPDCHSLTCAPVTVEEKNGTTKRKLLLKVGEAAHICSASSGGPRFDENLQPEDCASPDNGLWLCARCHTMIDKNKGASYSTVQLREWKRVHEEVIQSLLLAHRGTLPLLQRKTLNGKLAQSLVDVISTRGAFFENIHYEMADHVESSVEYTRSRAATLGEEIVLDSALRKIFGDIAHACREYMNRTGRFPGRSGHELISLRNKIGVLLLNLKEDYGCDVKGAITEILPGGPPSGF